MNPRSTKFPAQSQLVFPLIEAVEELGGGARAMDVAGLLAERFSISNEDAAATTTTSDGQVVSGWGRHVRFAREKAKAMGYLVSETRRWHLTDEGSEGLANATAAVVVEIITDPAGTPIGARVNAMVGVPTTHTIVRADARSLPWIGAGEIPLIVTSCPYFDIKRYEDAPGQLARLPSYEAFLDGLDDVWRECMRVLMPGGRMIVNVGDVLRSRARHGEHHVLPLHADILTRSTRMGFRALNGILWSKIGNCAYEEGGSGVLGQPGQPNGVIRSEIEHLLVLRKSGPYRNPTKDQIRDSALAKDEYGTWFRSIWNDVPGTSTKLGHPAPFPVEIPYRLIRMFSFANDTVLDPMAGSGTTALAAAKAGRNSVCTDVAGGYVEMAIKRLRDAA